MGLRVKKLFRLCWPFFAGVAPLLGLLLAAELFAGVDLAGALGAGLAEADVKLDRDSAAGFGFAVAPPPRLDPTTTAVSDSSDEYDSYSSTVFVTV